MENCFAILMPMDAFIVKYQSKSMPAISEIWPDFNALPAATDFDTAVGRQHQGWSVGQPANWFLNCQKVASI